MGRKILVVEDSRTINALVSDALVRNGYETVSAYDGDRAIRTFDEESFDAVVLDLNVPKVHGLEVLRLLKHRQPFAVVVVLTGHGSEQTALQALKLGADDYLTKPFKEPSLLESLEIHLQRADLQRCLDIPGKCPVHVEERYLARVFFDAPAALLHADPTGTIRAVNRSAARLLARSPDELLGQPVEQVVGEDVRAKWLETVRREAATPKGYEGEVHVRGATGMFPASVLAVEKPEAGHLILALKDLTRQKALEKRYFESKKLASLGRVVEGVAHEVRNPLISIGGFARKLRTRCEKRSRDARYLDVILSEVERLEQMVRDIEDYVQFSAQSRRAFAPVDLQSIVEDCLASISGKAEVSGVRICLKPAGTLPRIYGDASLVTELFHGLIENACEAMAPGGDLTVEFRLVDRWVQARVKDTGVGIAAKDLEEIFDPFFTSKTAGAGLGLAKAYLIVEEHSGTIDFESRVGEGTICTVSLPVDRRQMPRAAV